MPNLRISLILSATLLSACSGEAGKQEDEYTIMRRTAASSEELCDRARHIADLHREADNRRKLEEWEQIAFVHCLDVRLGL